MRVTAAAPAGAAAEEWLGGEGGGGGRDTDAHLCRRGTRKSCCALRSGTPAPVAFACEPLRRAVAYASSDAFKSTTQRVSTGFPIRAPVNPAVKRPTTAVRTHEPRRHHHRSILSLARRRHKAKGRGRVLSHFLFLHFFREKRQFVRYFSTIAVVVVVVVIPLSRVTGVTLGSTERYPLASAR